MELKLDYRAIARALVIIDILYSHVQSELTLAHMISQDFFNSTSFFLLLFLWLYGQIDRVQRI